MYPTDSLVWERCFEGVRIAFHSANYIECEARIHGLTMVEEQPIYFVFPVLRRKMLFGYIQIFQYDT